MMRTNLNQILRNGVAAAALASGIGLLGGPGIQTAQAQQSFPHAVTITIPAGAPGTTIGPATPFPSSLNVTGLKRGVTHVTLQVVGFSHTFPQDVSMLLVGPQGQTCILTGRCGDGTDISGSVITFDDDAPVSVPTPFVTGTFRPSTCIAESFSAPAPAAPYGSTLSVFNGTNGNGKWDLYIQDFSGADVGSVSLGWILNITEAGAPEAKYSGAGFNIVDNAPASLYPSNIIVSGMTGTVTGIAVRFNNLSHAFPRDIDALLVGPNGQKSLVMSDVGSGGPGVSGITIGFTHNAATHIDPNLPPIDGTTYLPTDNDPTTDVFPAPAPVGPYVANFGVFAGGNPNGTWSLYVRDDLTGDAGSLGSWDLIIYQGERCPADFNNSGALEVQDIFDFLGAWFAGCP